MKKIDWRSWGIRAGALILAFFLWFYAVTEHLYEREMLIRLQVDEPEVVESQPREVIIANLLPEHVRIVVSGRGKDLLQLDEDAFLLKLKAEGKAGSVRTYRLTPAMVENRMPDLDIEISKVVSPEEIEILLDWREEREVPIRPRVELEVEEAFVQVGELDIAPRSVKISGPKTQIERVEQVSTDSLRLQGLREDVDYRLALHAPEGMRVKLNPDHVQIQANIQILAEDDIMRVPVRVRHAMGRKVELEPAKVQVKVRGGVDVIAGLNPEEDLQLFVDFRDFTGEDLSVLNEATPLFEVIEIIPSKVHLIER